MGTLSESSDSGTRSLSFVERWVGGLASVRRRLEQCGGEMTVEQFRAEQVIWGSFGWPLRSAVDGLPGDPVPGPRRRAGDGPTGFRRLEHLSSVPAGGTLVAVTHGGTARAAVGLLLELPDDCWTRQVSFGNACWSTLVEADLGWRLEQHNNLPTAA